MVSGLKRWGLEKYCSGCDFYNCGCTEYLPETLRMFTGADSCSRAQIGGMKVILFEKFARTEQGDFPRNSPELLELIHQYQEGEARRRAELEEAASQRHEAQRPKIGLGAWMTPHLVRGTSGCGIAQGLRDLRMGRGMR